GSLGTPLGVGLLADPDQPAVSERVQVRRVAGDLQLAGDLRGPGITQVDGVERIGLPERHHVTGALDEADTVDPFPLAEPGDPTGLGQRRPVRAQYVHRRTRLRVLAPALAT